MTNLKITRGLFFALSKELLLPDCFDSSGLEATVAGDQREAKVEGSCSDDAVGHIRNDFSRYALQSSSNVGVERNNRKCGILVVQFTREPIERIGVNAPALD